MAEFGIANGRLGKIGAYQEQKQKLSEIASVNSPALDKRPYSDRPKAIQEKQTSFADTAKGESPYLDKMTWKNTGIVPMPGQGEYRTQALRDMSEDEFAKNQQAMNASDKEYWVEQAKVNPTSSYVNLRNFLASNETPEQKAKRERREHLGEVFNNLGNLIGNAANLYYTTKGGQYIDLNSVNEKHRERMDRIKEKQDALAERQKEILMNARLGDIQAARKAAADKEQREYNEQIRKENRAYQEKKDKQNQENWVNQFEWNVKQAEQNAADKAEEREYRRTQDKNNLAYKWADLNFRRENAKNSNSSGGKKDKIQVVGTKNGPMNVDFEKLNDATIAQLYQKIPKEVRDKYNISGLDNRNERLLRMNEAIGDALDNVDGYADWFIQSGVGTYQQQQKPGDYSGYLMDDYDGYMRKTGQAPPVNASESSTITPESIQATLDANRRKKSDMLQAGKDSLYKNAGFGMKSDTFR